MKKITDALTLEEKVQLCSGATEWDTKAFENAGIPSVKVADGPHGLRKTVGKGDNLGLVGSYPSTCFPAECLLACSFDRKLSAKMGSAIAEEAGAAGVCTFLGPGANIKRNPLCGRNFEYLSEDPFLAGRMASEYIKSAEEKGIGTSLKHFACNNQEYYRMTSDSRIDERTLREIYLSGFEYAVKNGKPSTVMCGYNLLNGVACSDNKYLLTDVLRDDWGFDGLVVSDWGALNDRTKAFEAGCDLIMPGGSEFGEKDAINDVKSGKLKIEDVDKCAERVAQFAINKSKIMAEKKFNADFKANNELAKEIAEKSAVLLKNENSILPLNGDEKLAVIGDMAKNFRFQGAGSSKINPTETDDFLSYFPSAKYAQGCNDDGSTTEALIKEAVDVAKACDKVIIVAGLPSQYEAEGLDRRTMSMPDGHIKMINSVSEANKNVIVVLLCGCVVEVPWENKVDGIMWMGLPGQAGAGALAELLTGKVNPSGKLAETWPISYADVPSSNCYIKSKHAEYTEGLYVGYRYYDKAKIKVRYPFGYGLSYTKFEYSNLQYENGTVRIDVKNVGKISGEEAVLFYVKPPQNSVHRPIKELKGFDKIHLEPNETKTVKFDIDERTFAVWNDGWVVYSGKYTLQIENCRKEIAVNGKECPPPSNSWYDTLDGKPNRDDWIEQLGYTPKELPCKPYTVNSTVSDIANDSFVIRVIYNIFEKVVAKKYGKGNIDYLIAMSSADECPLRAVQMFLGIKGNFAKKIASLGNKKSNK